MKKIIILSLVFILFFSACSQDETIDKTEEVQIDPDAPEIEICENLGSIENIEIVPKINCFVVFSNNCNGGVLVLHNQCNKVVFISDLDARPGDAFSFELVVLENKSGGITYARKTEANKATFFPEEDVVLQTNGRVGDEYFVIKYDKLPASLE